ncbi:fumarate reductase flavoprotein subunit [Ligilactobacillus sp. WC1T17]|uniref:Fumarate reductase flavoprotein subunit n=1 Tax=Ligilactobacillus ruminis TaxID=1623 RepID=A0ABY1ACA9_9LACO|nr:fumarate reductase flavoprotein subunit [Ligilactobacillus ruminis]
MKDKKADIIVVGAGCAGLVAAIQARELHQKVIVLEKMAQAGGNSMRASSGMNAAETIPQLKAGVIDDWHAFYAETLKGGGYLNDPSLLEYFASHSALAIDWLAAHGIILDDLTITGGMSVKRTHRPHSMAPVGAFLIKHLLKRAQELDIPVICQTKVQKLLQKDDRIVGVATNQGEFKAKAVILATGGFGASPALIQKYRPDLASFKTTNHQGATGDGLKLGLEIGAQLTQMELIQVHPTVNQDTDHAYLIGEAVRGEGAILVNQQGMRFVNELATRKVVSAAITALPEKSAYLLFDDQVKNRVKAIDFYQQKGLVKQAESIDSLAEMLKMDTAELASTVKRWNQMATAKKDRAFQRTTGLKVLSKKPYYAIHVAPAIHYTMGGLHINDKAEVFDQNGEIIGGLYACGEVCGGLHGNNRIGGNSIAETVIFGRQAGLQAVCNRERS